MKTIIIQNKKKYKFLNIKEIFAFKDLFYILFLRDLKLRYKQTAIGVIWIVLQPLITVVMFTVIFGKIAKLPNEGVPYLFFTFAAILPWTFFSQSINRSCNSFVSQEHLISKVYFPRILLPTSCCLATFFDFIISSIVMFALLFCFKVHISSNICFLPLMIIILMMLSIGWGLILASLNVYYRDISYLVPFAIQIGTFVSPIGYSSSLIPEKFKLIFSCNPLVGIIEGFRWAFFGTQPFPLISLSFSFVFSLFSIIIGIILFEKIEKYFADII